MIPKVEACLRALDRVPQATILDGGRPHAIVEHLLEGRTAGHRLYRRLKGRPPGA